MTASSRPVVQTEKKREIMTSRPCETVKNGPGKRYIPRILVPSPRPNNEFSFIRCKSWRDGPKTKGLGVILGTSLVAVVARLHREDARSNG